MQAVTEKSPATDFLASSFVLKIFFKWIVILSVLQSDRAWRCWGFEKHPLRTAADALLSNGWYNFIRFRLV
jgi:hypothetical protein